MSDERPVQADEVPLHERVTQLADRLQNEEGVDLWATARLLDRLARQLKLDNNRIAELEAAVQEKDNTLTMVAEESSEIVGELKARIRELEVIERQHVTQHLDMLASEHIMGSEDHVMLTRAVELLRESPAPGNSPGWPPPVPEDLRSRAQAVLETLIPLAPYLGLVDLDYVHFPHDDGSIEGQLSWRWADPNQWNWPEENPEEGDRS